MAICPAIKDEGVSIVKGDSASVLKCLPPKSVDLAITDPPYGSKYFTNFRKKIQIKGMDGIECDTAECILPKFKAVVDELDRVMKDDAHVYVFTRWDKVVDFYPIINAKFPIKNMIVVNKNNWSMGNLFGAYANKYEVILFGSKQNKHLNCIGNTCRHTDVIDVKRVSGNKQLHSHQKPDDLIDFLIDKSSLPGEKVIDPFVGSGTTCAAAKRRGRRCIGVDIDPESVRIAKKRVRDA